MGFGFLFQVVEVLLNHHRILDAGDDPDCPAAEALQVSMSILNTRFKRCAHVMDARRSADVGGPLPADRTIITENELALAIRDGFPVTEGHTLVIPKRHVVSYFELGQPMVNAISCLLGKLRDSIRTDDTSVTGFNVGINDGPDARQTIFHVHVHLMPRRKGDVESPRCGVRNTIPGKGVLTQHRWKYRINERSKMNQVDQQLSKDNTRCMLFNVGIDTWTKEEL